MRKQAHVWFLTLILLMGLFPITAWAARGTQSAPKLLNLYLGWRIKDEDQAALAKWDIVVLDMDVGWQFPDRIRQLRKDNPNIKILAYVSAGELADARALGSPTSPSFHLSQLAKEPFFMHQANGARLNWWPGARLMNATDVGPMVNGERWNDALPRFIRDELMSTGLWDGVFLDAAYSDITYFFGKDIDPNGDGVANSVTEINTSWRTGMTKLIRNVRREMGPGRLILSNSSDAYAADVNGILFENFPQYGWTEPFKQYLAALQKNVAPAISTFNTNTQNVEAPQNYRLMRYGLGSTLLGNSYYSFDAGDRGHERTWWYDEYDTSLGSPQGAMRRVGGVSAPIVPGVWMRAFEKGIVLVNSDTVSRRVPLPGTFEKIRGTQDRGVNDGSLVRTLDIPPQDAVILLGQAEANDVRDGGYVNGSFTQVYAMNGVQVRNGFFPQQDGLPSGRATQSLVDGTGRTILAYNDSGSVRVIVGGGAATVLRPFGSRYLGRMSFALGNTNRDPALEIVVARDKAGPPEVRVLTLSGKLLSSWMAYRPTFNGGVRVAIGDLDGDGRREIVTGAGPGGGPHVRLFKTDGAPWGGSFFAFGQDEHGGVSVAVGDVDHDGKDEIVVGSGEGAIPRVRVFDSRGGLRSEFSLGTRPLLAGLTVSVADVNGDGKKEILVSGLNPF